MRRFEFVGDGSEKFWEIGREGGEVTVRFGRIGTNGQTQTKDLGTAEAATAHVAKLVAEKTKKGYVEGAASKAAGGPPPKTKARVAKVEAVEEAEEPMAPVVESVAPRAELGPLPDEDAFVVPSAWSRQAETFRGLRRPPDMKLDERSVLVDAQALRTRFDSAVRTVLSHPSSASDLVRRAELHTGTTSGLLRRSRQQDDPLGAAVLMIVLRSCLPWNEQNLASVIIDELVVRYGGGFAAEAGAHLASLAISGKRGVVPIGGPQERWIKTAAPNEFNAFVLEPFLSRLRAHLASLDEGPYRDVVGRLQAMRQGPLPVRIVTSYLVPTQQDWVAQDISGLSSLGQHGLSWPMLLASAKTLSDVNAILAVVSPWTVVRRPSLMYSIAVNLGTDATGPLVGLFDSKVDAATKKRLLQMIGAIPTDDAFVALVDRIDQKYVSPVVIETMARYPVRAARILAARSSGSDAKARSCKELLRGHLISNPGLAEHLGPTLDGGSAKAIQSISRASEAMPVASATDLPDVLMKPPWKSGKRGAKPVVVAGLSPPSGLTLRWAKGEQQSWVIQTGSQHWTRKFAGDWNSAVRDAVDPSSRTQFNALQILAAAPPDVVRPYLARFTPKYTWSALNPLKHILAGVGDDALVFTYRVVMTRPATLAPVLLPIEGSEVAARMAEWLVRSKRLRPLARTWLDRHPDASARDLVPAALSKPGKDRTAAEAALRVLDQAGHRQTILKAAATYGKEASAAVEGALDADPLDRLPATIPTIPVWLDPAHLPQVLLPDRRSALPPEAVTHLCTMLAMSKPGDTYAGVEVVKAAVDPQSLAEMAWGLLERWQGAGFPSKESWVLESLGLVGDDDTVRQLAPMIRAWPGDGAHSRAVAGLDVLAAIGSDVALMHLHGIAEKAKFKGLKTKAKEKMDEVADGLGLSAEQLADRLVPDFGLDQDGSMILDYGPRRFRVGFDEQLKPVVADEDGSRRQVLPKPSAKDDQSLAVGAYSTFSGLKKDVKVIAADQIRRFERAMVLSRRWSSDEQRTLFVEHPLLWHLTRRLVWATFDRNGEMAGSFRVAEDRTFANPDDNEISIDPESLVGIAHPLQLVGALERWSEIFADYEILQPFPQLGRDIWQLTAADKKATVINPLSGVTIETGRILGLAHRGWERGPVMDGGVSGTVQKQAAGGRTLIIDLDPGIIAGMAMEWKEQKIAGVWISDGPAEWGSPRGGHPFSVLDDITASELLRDLQHLRG